MEKDLSIEKNWRTELQTELNEKNASLKNATEKLDTLDQIEQVFNYFKDSTLKFNVIKSGVFLRRISY